MFFSIQIEGKPYPCPRPRTTKKGHTYMPKDYNEQKKKNIEMMEKRLEIGTWKKEEDRPCKLTVMFIHKRPQRMYSTGGRSPKVTRPDIDNLLKTVMDTIQSAGLIKDDSQIVSVHCIDLYGAKDEKPHTDILLELYK